MSGGVADSELLDLLLDASPDGVMDWDLCAGTVRYTARWKLLLGYDSTLPDTPQLWRELSHPDDLPRVEELLRDHLESIWPFTHTWRMRHACDGWRWLLVRAVTVRDAAQRPLRLVAVWSDITDRIRAEERQRALTSAIPDLLLRVRADGTVVDVKPPEGAALPGLSWPAVGEPLSSWGPAAEWHGRVLAGSAAADPPRAPACFEVVLASEAARRQAEVRVVPSGDDEVVCIVRDVTDQRQMQSQLLQAHKLESIGQLAAGIAHEINTPMQFIGDSLVFVEEACRSLMTVIAAYQRAVEGAQTCPVSDDERAGLRRLTEAEDLDYLRDKVPGALANALEGVRRVARIVSAMKQFSHPGKSERAPCDLNREIETTVTISANTWKYVADLEQRLDPGLPLVPCHPGEINQVVLNLIVNAAHAIADVVGADGSKGVIAISTAAVGPWAELRVSDTGTGIPEHVRRRIFDPFFTTKEVGRGTGQGLTIARSTIVDKHGGSIDFESTPGRGTTFIVRLPLVVPAPR